MTSPQVKGKQVRTFAMTDLKAHEDWGAFGAKNPRAASVLHYLVARAGRYGSVTVSHPVLAEICGTSVPTLKRALKKLQEDNWIQIVRLGSQRGGVNCYLIDKGVCWSAPRDRMAYVDIDTRIIASAHEQPAEQLKHDGELRSAPIVGAGEEPVPAGQGADPPSQPSFEGLEPVIYRDSAGRYYEHDPDTGEVQQRLDEGEQ